MGSQVVNTANAGELDMFELPASNTTEQIAGLRKHGFEMFFRTLIILGALYLSASSTMQLFLCIVEYGELTAIMAHFAIIIVSYYTIREMSM